MANTHSPNTSLAPIAPNEWVFDWYDHTALWLSLSVGLLVMQRVRAGGVL